MERKIKRNNMERKYHGKDGEKMMCVTKEVKPRLLLFTGSVVFRSYLRSHLCIYMHVCGNSREVEIEQTYVSIGIFFLLCSLPCYICGL